MGEDKFIVLSALICEPARAKMLWNLLDGRAYTAGELAIAADISPTSASNHLAKLLEADLLKVESQGRHRYFSFSRPEVAYVVESLANLANQQTDKIRSREETVKTGVKYCRSCYDHLAGQVGVQMTDAFEHKNWITKDGSFYLVNETGWKHLKALNISENDLTAKRRPVAKQCLDWSERRPHLAGQLGALVLNRMLEKQWFRKVQFSRELILTDKGRLELYDLLDIRV
jgi:DNA-binding transcriptional ArsR family regulator